jgi:hypothetical protein
MNDKWIPTKVRLPKEHGFYMVTAKYSAKQVEVLRVNWAGEWCYFPGVKITAWQPMPEPYSGEA